MTKNTANFIIIGGGLYGSAIAYNLVKNGATGVVVLERGTICSGGTAKSCGNVRTHYSIKNNLVHAVESLKIFSNFNERVGGDCGWKKTGFLILGQENDREPMLEVFRTQNEYGIDTQLLDSKQTHEIHPFLNLEDIEVIGYDTFTGVCDPYLTTTAYAERAKDLGVKIHTHSPVIDLKLDGSIKIAKTPNGTFESPVVILAAGPWTNPLAKKIGIEFPYQVTRHKVFTLKSDQSYLNLPIVKDMTTAERVYFRPESGGLCLFGTGDTGEPIEDADILTDHIDLEHIEHIGKFIVHRMPAFKSAEFQGGWTGPYDIPPDWNPIVGHVNEIEGLHVAVGFSGHGFKLAPTISESLAQTVLGFEPRIPIDIYNMSRFSEGRLIQGAYGSGSIS